MKLSKKAAKEISGLINEIMVAKTMCKDGFSKGHWMRNEAQANVDLADKFGIELPSLKMWRELLADGTFDRWIAEEQGKLHKEMKSNVPL